jgi:hypothetical protein
VICGGKVTYRFFSEYFGFPFRIVVKVRGLYGKVDELTTHWLNHFPHMLCITEHHLRDFKSILVQLYSNTTNLIICGDININYLKTSKYKTQLDYLLASYNLSTAVNFPTRITKNTSTAIDNIFIDKTNNSNYTIEPIINGLSDHNAQELVLQNIKIINQETQFTVKWLINNTTIAQFKLNLSYEGWSDTFTEDVDSNLKNF